MHTIKITPNLLFEYQCTSGIFIRLPNRIEKIDSVARIESKLFCRSWNALAGGSAPDPGYRLALPRSPCPRLQTPIPDCDSEKVATLIGRRITVITEDSRETVFLFQHLSIALQWRNVFSFLNTFTATD